MKSNTTAFLALWNGLRDLSVLEEYERWHSIEHVPERLSVPGILEARRYGSLEVAGQFFTGYWLADLAALKNAAYQALLQHPTPWSARMRLQLTNFVRHPAQRLGSAGVTRGKALATLLLTRPAAVPLQEALRHLAQQLGQVVTAGVLLRAEWFLVVDEGLSQHPLGLQGTDNVPPEARVVLLLEHSTPQALQAFLASPEALPTPWVAQAPARYFGLLSTVAQADLYPDGLLARPAARVDLMP
jgi:hypothetical protein